MAKMTKRRKALEEKIGDPHEPRPIVDALAVVKDVASVKFDETIDVAIKLGVDAGLSQHAHDSLTDRFVIQVPVVGTFQAKGEPVGISGLCQQRLRIVDIVFRTLGIRRRIASHCGAD